MKKFSALVLLTALITSTVNTKTFAAPPKSLSDPDTLQMSIIIKDRKPDKRISGIVYRSEDNAIMISTDDGHITQLPESAREIFRAKEMDKSTSTMLWVKHKYHWELIKLTEGRGKELVCTTFFRYVGTILPEEYLDACMYVHKNGNVYLSPYKDRTAELFKNGTSMTLTPTMHEM